MSQFAMFDLNQVFLVGRLTHDPELRYIPSGTAVATLRVAVGRQFKTKTGEKKEEVCFVNVVVWDKQAEFCTQYLSKGRPIFVDGSLQSRQWETNDGQKRSTIEIRARRIQALDFPEGTGGAKAAQVAEEPPLSEEEPF